MIERCWLHPADGGAGRGIWKNQRSLKDSLNEAEASWNLIWKCTQGIASLAPCNSTGKRMPIGAGAGIVSCTEAPWHLSSSFFWPLSELPFPTLSFSSLIAPPQMMKYCFCKSTGREEEAGVQAAIGAHGDLRTSGAALQSSIFQQRSCAFLWPHERESDDVSYACAVGQQPAAAKGRWAWPNKCHKSWRGQWAG